MTSLTKVPASSPEEDAVIKAFNNRDERLSAEEILPILKAALVAFGAFFARAEISHEMQAPYFRDACTPLTVRDGTAVYSGDEKLCNAAIIDDHTRKFLNFVVKKHNVKFVKDDGCPVEFEF